ncbi:hypothetical protein B4102_1418 [Heyndrickxia sporothermodurans]|uniref:Uncharacterized protein n=1 Tax=Heyndrickxia sporothermodurans TaxID=46224 RepID=A0A150KMV6_9BACI|nr:hypothetical protein B4102_1418 [Heyndrickxia sporothermodurans]
MPISSQGRFNKKADGEVFQPMNFTLYHHFLFTSLGHCDYFLNYIDYAKEMACLSSVNFL